MNEKLFIEICFVLKSETAYIENQTEFIADEPTEVVVSQNERIEEAVVNSGEEASVYKKLILESSFNINGQNDEISSSESDRSGPRCSKGRRKAPQVQRSFRRNKELSTDNLIEEKEDSSDEEEFSDDSENGQ